MTKTVTSRSVFQTEASKKFWLVDEAGATAGVGRRCTQLLASVSRTDVVYRNNSDCLSVEAGDSDAELFKPQCHAWPGHCRWNDDASELIGITTAGRATFDLLRINRPHMIRVRKMRVAMSEHPQKQILRSGARSIVGHGAAEHRLKVGHILFAV